jgi:TPR repeat protein
MQRTLQSLVIVLAACGGGAASTKHASVGDAPENAQPAAVTCDKTDCVSLGDRAADANRLGEALAYYAKGCELAVAIACGSASMLILQEGRDVPKGYALMLKACELADSRACNNAGAAWSEGIHGATAVDHAKARGFYEKSCSLDNGMGCFNLGNVYRIGEGVPADMKVAFGHFKKSCELGEATGCTELAIMYYEGKVVPQDVSVAKQLFERACKLGSETSCKNLQQLNP